MKIVAAVLSLVVASSASAEPTSSPLLVNNIRPYGGTDIVFIVTNNTPNSFCPTSLYSLSLASNAGKAMYAAALTALATGKYVQLELITGAPCGNGPSGSNALQSIAIQN